MFSVLINEFVSKKVSFKGKKVYLKRIAWAQKNSIREKENSILEKYCGVNPETLVDSKTGHINLKYDPKKDINRNYYI